MSETPEITCFSLYEEINAEQNVAAVTTQISTHYLFNWSITAIPIEGGDFELYLNSECTDSDAPGNLKNQLEGKFNISVANVLPNVSGELEVGSTRIYEKVPREVLTNNTTNIFLYLFVEKSMGQKVPLKKDHPMKLSIGGKKFEVSKTTIEKCFSRLKRDFELSSETPMSSELVKLCEETLERKAHEIPFGIVNLNVGGTVFQTTKATLTRFDGMFKTMLDNGITVKINEIDTLFIDRSPKHFDLILNFMRDGDVEFPENSREIREIRREAQYYLLGGLVEACEQFFVAVDVP
ncbi:hypothetical protein L3Y34_002417 [Caenorhabditis briggsae]|uniref:BTB domain-containing protein n=1 Tax=Caenorhabditis briggsae TaxID=6238 RepID=A0AAE9IRN8_CAEBR|nr:hypothetical protein L3Y34_002417 [Caenorhabditis briggsae]